MGKNDTKKELEIKTVQMKEAEMVIRAINHGLRRQMLNLMHRNVKMSVTDIYMKLNIEQSVASLHLAILRQVGFVTTSRGGRCVYYAVNYKRLEEVGHILRSLLKP